MLFATGGSPLGIFATSFLHRSDIVCATMLLPFLPIPVNRLGKRFPSIGVHM